MYVRMCANSKIKKLSIITVIRNITDYITVYLTTTLTKIKQISVKIFHTYTTGNKLSLPGVKPGTLSV